MCRLQVTLLRNTPMAMLWNSSDVCVIVWQTGAARHTNLAADRLLKQRTVKPAGASVAFVDPAAQCAFEHLRSVDKGLTVGQQTSLFVDAGDDGRVVVQMMRFIPDAQSARAFGLEDFPAVLIAATLADRVGSARKRAILALAALTRSEKEVLAALVGGESVETITKRTKRSMQTTRWHVRNIVQKTGSTSLIDAVRLAGQLLPL